MAKGRSTLLGQMVGRLRATTYEGFLGPDVLSLFKFLKLKPQAAVRCFQPLFQGGEIMRPNKLKCRQHTQPQWPMNGGVEAVEVNRLHGSLPHPEVEPTGSQH